MNKMRFKVYGISFADARYLSFQMSRNEVLTVFLSSWQEKEIKVDFINTIRFSYTQGSFISDLFEISESTYMDEVIESYYDKKPNEVPFKHYQLVDIEDVPFIEVVAEYVKVVQSDSSIDFYQNGKNTNNL